MMDPVSSYFRCASEVSGPTETFELGSKVRGYFRFGDGVVCFGRTESGISSPKPNAELYDASLDLDPEQSDHLPFSPREIVENLSQEKYVGNGAGPTAKLIRTMIRRTYYGMRPYFPLAFRSQLQKFYLRNWQQITFPKWPVDTSIDDFLKRLLAIRMKALGIQSLPFIWFWPKAASSCVLMTHDVEEEVGRDFCSTLMDINDSFGIAASFQVVPEERYEVPSSYLREIKDRDFEVNVQDLNHDGRLYWSLDEFKRRVKRINQYGREWDARGFRAGILYRNPDWFRFLEFDYEMSVPNVAHLDPQRGGCCTVMPYFVGDILELPVTTSQDHTIFHILKTYSLDLWKQQIEIILRHNGMISFIVHPDYIIEERARSAYKELLAELDKLRQERNLWIAHPNSVNRWWRNRSEMTLRQDGEKWVIEGPDSERACLAFAHLEGDSIVYEVAHCDGT